MEPFDRLLQEIKGAVVVTRRTNDWPMEAMVTVERRGIERSNPIERFLLPAFESVDERRQLSCVREVGRGGVQCCCVLWSVRMVVQQHEGASQRTRSP